MVFQQTQVYTSIVVLDGDKKDTAEKLVKNYSKIDDNRIQMAHFLDIQDRRKRNQGFTVKA